MDPMMQSASFVRHPVLAAARAFSLEWLERMRLTIDAEASGLPGLVTVVTAGSFGRLEASLCSDADVVVVVEDELASDSTTARAIHRRLYECLSGLGLLLPKSWGIFTSPTTLAELVDPQRLGRLDESPTVFGKRMQILLDSRAAWSPEGLVRVQKGILDWYATAFVESQPEAGWRLLVCDLVRYWRSYCAWQLFELKADEDDAWILRQVKLNHSRFMNYAGMVCLLGEASRQSGDGHQFLLQGLMLTPLDRVRMAYLRVGDPGFVAIEQPYARIVAALEDGATRARMVALSPRQPHELPPALPEDIRALLDAAEQAQTEFARFLQRRNGDWSEGFLRSLLI